MKYSEQVTNSRQTPCALGQAEAAKRAAAAGFFCGDDRNMNLCYTKKYVNQKGRFYGMKVVSKRKTGHKVTHRKG